MCVSFAQAKTRDFDLVIGADGLHSNVRRLTFGPESDVEHYLGCLVAACVVEGYRPRDDLVYVTYSEPGRSVGRFSLRGDRAMFLFVFRSDQAADPGELAARKALLRREFGDAGWECPQILAALDGVDDLYFDVVSQIRLDRWARGRTALVGDAAACVSLLAGEGTGLAMTEAYVLAGELAVRSVAITGEPSTPTRPDCAHSSKANRPPGGSFSPSSRRRRGWASGFATWQCGR